MTSRQRGNLQVTGGTAIPPKAPLYFCRLPTVAGAEVAGATTELEDLEEEPVCHSTVSDLDTGLNAEPSIQDSLEVLVVGAG